MTLAAVFPLAESFHRKIFFFFNLPCLLGKEIGMTTLAGEFLSQVKFVFKNDSPYRFDKNYGPSAIFLGLNSDPHAGNDQQKRKKHYYSTYDIHAFSGFLHVSGSCLQIKDIGHGA